MATTRPLGTVGDQILPSRELSATDGLKGQVQVDVPSSVAIPPITAAPSPEDSGTVPGVQSAPDAVAPPTSTVLETTTPPATVPAGPAAGECTPANIDIQRYDPAGAILKPIPAEQQQYYTVLGCAEGWLAYAISDDGVRAAGLDGGNVYYSLARLQSDGRYLTDFEQSWQGVHTWEFLATAVQYGRYATVQDAMDDQFATNGIPVRLREQLVGPGPAAGTA